MNQGVKESSETNNLMDIEEGPFANLLPELVGRIAGFLPAWQTVGEHSVYNVSHTWLSQPPQGRMHYTSTQVMESCDSDDVSIFLKDNGKFNHISFNDLMDLICHDQLMFKKTLPYLTTGIVTKLAIKHQYIARIILAEYKKCPLAVVIEMISYHEELAHEKLNEIEKDSPPIFDFVSLAAHHLSVAKRIVSSPDRFNVRGGLLFTIYSNHKDLALELLRTDLPEVQRIHSGSWINLNVLILRGGVHPEVAQMLLERYEDKLSDADWLWLGKIHVDIAERIFDTPHLFRRLSTHQMFSELLVHPSIKQRLRDSIKLKELLQINEFDLIDDPLSLPKSLNLLADKKLLEFARKSNSKTAEDFVARALILDSPLTAPLLDERFRTTQDFYVALLNIAITNPDVWDTIQNNKGLIFSFIEYKQTHPLIISLLLNPDYKVDLSEDILLSLCIKSVDIGNVIINNPLLIQKLSPRDLLEVALRRTEFAEAILNNEVLRARLSRYITLSSWAPDCSIGTFLSTAKLLLSFEDVVIKIPSSDLTAILNRITAIEIIADEYKVQLTQATSVCTIKQSRMGD